MLFQIAALKGSNPLNADPSWAKKLPITQPKAEYLKWNWKQNVAWSQMKKTRANQEMKDALLE